jgi:hypothetical protein
MLSTNLSLTPADLETLQGLYVFLYEFSRVYDKITVDDQFAKVVLRPYDDVELNVVDKLRLRAMASMNETWQALPPDSPYLQEYADMSELWVPYNHEIEHIQKVIDS